MALWKGVAPNQAPNGLFEPIITASGTPSAIGQSTGTQIYNGAVILDFPAGTVIQVRNYESQGLQATGLNITPLPGGTQAQAAVLVITRLL